MSADTRPATVSEECALIGYLRAPGPQRMPLRMCCVVALVERDGVRSPSETPVCLLTPVAAESAAS